MKNLIQNALKVTGLILLAIYFTACNEGGGGSAGAAAAPAPTIVAPPADPGSGDPDPVTPPQAPAVPEDNDPQDPVVQDPQSVPVALTFYSKSFTQTVVAGKSYTVTGSCAVVRTKTYCWDDGVKTIAQFRDFQGHWLGPYSYTYWGLQTRTATTVQTCSGACVDSFMSVARDLTKFGLLPSNLRQNDVDAIFNTGSSSVVNCSELNDVLTCGSFTINLAQ